VSADRSGLDLGGPLPRGLTVLEASAGTGKTFALAALAARAVAERDVPASALCVVSFTDAATAELRGRIRARLVEAADHLAGSGGRDDPALAALARAEPAEVSRRRARLERAVADFDAATITTIHGFCSRVLAGAATTAGDVPIGDGESDVDEVVNDLMIARFGHDVPDELRPARVAAAVRARLSMPDARVVRPVVEPAPGPRSKAQALVRAVADVIDDAHDEVLRRRAARRRRTFDGLLSETRALLRSTRGPSIVAALRDRYRWVLVDEFQDTDRVQWDIFRTAFVDGARPADVVLVGDPKQSIYRFRAAELSAYLDATALAAQRHTLATNWRSDRPLLRALELLFHHYEFGHPDVAFHPVEAAPAHARGRMAGDGGASLVVRWVPSAAEGGLGTGPARAAVRRDVVTAVDELLHGPTTIDDAHGGPRRVRPRDIAILTRSNDDATTLALALGRAGVPAATASADSVLDSEAAAQWAVLLHALERPGHQGAARAAAVGWFIGWGPDEVGDLSDERAAALHDLIRTWSGELATHGVPRLLALARAAGLHARLLAQQGGERHLTDLEHIAELLQVGTSCRPTGAAALLGLLVDPTDDGDDVAAREALNRRIDRDDDAVQVLTIHKAKGLEFPIVLCPYLWTRTPGANGVRHAEVGGERHLDASWVAGVKRATWNGALFDADGDERDGEQRRLLYVAMTRARHRCVVWWAPVTTKGQRSTLGDLLQHATGSVPAQPEDLDGLVADGAGAVAVVPAHGRRVPRRAPGLDVAPLEVAAATRRLDHAWRIWSFTAISAASQRRRLGAATGRPSAWAEGEGGGVAGGDDERTPADHAAEVAPASVGPRQERPATAPPPDAGAAATPLATAPGGTEFGTLVHGLLERCDFASPTLFEDLRASCADALRFRHLAVDPDDLATGLGVAIDAPLGGPEGALRLRDLAPRDRLDELGFDLPLGRVRADAIGALLVDHLDPHDPLLPWARRMASAGYDIDVAGMLNGSIDLVARSGGGRRYWVADYKTNQLGAGSDYSTAALVAAMEHHDYPLQAVLYLVALHRYLRWRLRGYRPDEHLGGAAYLFLRGMRPVADPADARGVLWWRPPPAAVVALDRLLADGVAA